MSSSISSKTYIKRITDMIEAYENAYDSLSILLRYAHIMDTEGNKYREYNLKDLEALEAILEAPLKDIPQLTDDYDKDIDKKYDW